eukprot:XP_013971178.1 collagen alpha-1(I) chain-like [Canis lupus familiaris]
MTAGRCPGRSAPPAAASPRGFKSSSSPPSRPRRPESPTHRARATRAGSAASPPPPSPPRCPPGSAPLRSDRGGGVARPRRKIGADSRFPPSAGLPASGGGGRAAPGGLGGSGARGLGPRLALRRRPGRGASRCRSRQPRPRGRWCRRPARAASGPGVTRRAAGRGDASGSRAGAPRPAGGESETGARTGTRRLGGLSAGPPPWPCPKRSAQGLGSCAGAGTGRGGAGAPPGRGAEERSVSTGACAPEILCRQDAAQGACLPPPQADPRPAPQQMARAPSLPRTSPFRGAGTASGRHSHVPRERPLRARLPAPSPGPSRLGAGALRGCNRWSPAAAGGSDSAPPPGSRPRRALPALFSARGGRAPGAVGAQGPEWAPRWARRGRSGSSRRGWPPPGFRAPRPPESPPGAVGEPGQRGERAGASAHQGEAPASRRVVPGSAPRTPGPRHSRERSAGQPPWIPAPPRHPPRWGPELREGGRECVGTHAARPGRGQPLSPPPPSDEKSQT